MRYTLLVLACVILSQADAQIVQWVRNGGGASFDASYSVCVDAQGFSYVTGRYMGTSNFSGNTLNSFGLQDGYLAKYDPAGNLEWITHIGGSSMDCSNSICLDHSGHIIIGGQFVGMATFGSITLLSANNSYDCFVAQYDTSGNCLWALKGGSIGDYDNISGIAVNAANDIYVIGWLSTGAVLGWYTAPVTGIATTFVAKIRSTGALIWVTASCISTSGSMPLYSLKVVPDAFGNVYINSSFQGSCVINGNPVTASGLQDLYIQKLDFVGNILWTNIITGLFDDASWGIATDVSGNVIVSGYYKGTVDFGGLAKTSNSNSQDIFLVKYDKFGGLLWVQSYGGPNGDYVGSITVTPNDNIILAASFSLSTQIGSFPIVSYGAIDALVIYTNSFGIPLWVIKMGGTGTDQSFGVSENGGDIFCSGLFNSTANFNGVTATSNGAGDAFLVKIKTASPLPLQLIEFEVNADTKNNSANCKWTTAQEINNDFFTLEKSVDGKTFQNVAHIPATISTLPYHSYNFIDENPFGGISYYRLSQTDLNGSTQMLKTVSVNLKNKNNFSVECYPSVGNGELTINSNKAISEIRVFDATGNLIRDFSHSSSFDFLQLTALKNGIYFIEFLSESENEISNKKIIINH
ncbi:MAG: T9SS type A sorting domain-containing protein [Bacteroidia bacterium]